MSACPTPAQARRPETLVLPSSPQKKIQSRRLVMLLNGDHRKARPRQVRLLATRMEA